MRICATSDLHGFFPPIPDCDVLVIAGDIIGATSDTEEIAQWKAFRTWLEELRERRVIVVGCAGNHDATLERYPDFASSLPWLYLKDSGVMIGGVSFWGSPWQPWFYDGAFTAPRWDVTEEFLDAKFRQIPAATDVLVTHSPPVGVLDRVGQRLAGSTALRKHVERVMPTLHVFGHIHHGFGRREIGDVTFANVSHTSVKDGAYRPENPPVVFELASLQGTRCTT